MPNPMTNADAVKLAIKFHETYERLAPSFGYETRKDTRAFDPTTPNGKLMVAVCGELMSSLTASAQEPVAVPEGWKAIIVNDAFDDLLYWLDRADRKGHLSESLNEVWQKFQFKDAAATPPEQTNG